MLLRQRGSQRGHRAVKSILVQRDGVHITLRQDDEALLALFDDIHSEEVPPLVEDHRFRRVEIFRRGIVHDPAAEADHIAAYVNDREHQTIAEAVIERPFCFVLQHQTGLQQLLLGEALGGHGVEQRAPLIRRKAETEARDRIGRQTALGDIGAHLACLRRFELRVEKARSLFVQRPKAFFQLVLRLIFAVLRHLKPGALCQKTHRIRITEVLDLHDEADGAAALVAAEAVVDALLRRNGKGGRFFAVEGTEPEEIVASSGQRDVLPHNVLDGIAGIQLVQKCRRKGHVLPPVNLSPAKPLE